MRTSYSMTKKGEKMMIGGVLMLKSSSLYCFLIVFICLSFIKFVYLQYLCFVPLLCSIVLVVLSCITLSTITFVP